MSNINPFKPNGISHWYQLDQSIPVFRILKWYFVFIQILKEHSVIKQWSRLILFAYVPQKERYAYYGLILKIYHNRMMKAEDSNEITRLIWYNKPGQTLQIVSTIVVWSTFRYRVNLYVDFIHLISISLSIQNGGADRSL